MEKVEGMLKRKMDKKVVIESMLDDLVGKNNEKVGRDNMSALLIEFL